MSRNPHRSLTAQLLRDAIEAIKDLDDSGHHVDLVRRLEMLRDRWSTAYRMAEGCCRRWLSGINGTQER